MGEKNEERKVNVVVTIDVSSSKFLNLREGPPQIFGIENKKKQNKNTQKNKSSSQKPSIFLRTLRKNLKKMFLFFCLESKNLVQKKTCFLREKKSEEEKTCLNRL